MSEPEGGKQFAAFLGVGGVAALANFGSRFGFGLFTGFEVSVLLAFTVGLSTAFVLNRAWVFSGDRETTWKTEAMRFLVVNLGGLVVTMAAAVASQSLLQGVFGAGAAVDGVAHLVGLGATAVTSYFAHKYWTFRG